MSAGLAPAVGRWCDHGRGPFLMQAGGFLAAVLLVAWVLIPGVTALYVVWSGLGLCMAAVLYEPAFVIVGRTYDDPSTRLRALALITVFGGLASTVFLPATAFLVTSWGWRSAVLCLACTIASWTWVLGAALRDVGDRAVSERIRPTPHPSAARNTGPAFVAIAAMFALGTLASGALTTNLVPALSERGVSPASAAMVGGLMGVMQLPGRALLVNTGLASSPLSLLAVSLLLHAAGLGAIALAPSTPMVGFGAMVFAVGAGLTTVVRPYVIQSVWGTEQTGDLNGRVARWQQLARAAGPIAMAFAASRFTYALVLAGLAASFVIVSLAVPAACRRSHTQTDEGDDMTEQGSNTKSAQSSAPCCDSTTLQTCCGAHAKASCCGPSTAPKVCGCGASSPVGSVVRT